MPWKRPSSHPTSWAWAIRSSASEGARRIEGDRDRSSSAARSGRARRRARGPSARRSPAAARGSPRRAGAWRTSSSSCLTIEPMRITFAGRLDRLGVGELALSGGLVLRAGIRSLDHLGLERRLVAEHTLRCVVCHHSLSPPSATRGTNISAPVSEPCRDSQPALSGVGRIDEGDLGVNGTSATSPSRGSSPSRSGPPSHPASTSSSRSATQVVSP